MDNVELFRKRKALLHPSSYYITENQSIARAKKCRAVKPMSRMSILQPSVMSAFVSARACFEEHENVSELSEVSLISLSIFAYFRLI
jgi:hypothetical protein